MVDFGAEPRQHTIARKPEQLIHTGDIKLGEKCLDLIGDAQVAERCPQGCAVPPNR